MTFFGMNARSSYLAFKEHEDTFTAFDKHGTLTTWNTKTGKLLKEKRIPLKLNKYKVFQTQEDADKTYMMGWYQKGVLLVSEQVCDELAETKDQTFYENYRKGIITKKSTNQLPDMDFKEFKVIELVVAEGEFNVKVHMAFKHPVFN